MRLGTFSEGMQTSHPTISASEEAELAGFDLTLIDESLRCSYEQRAIQHQAALELALEIEAAGQRLGD